MLLQYLNIDQIKMGNPTNDPEFMSVFTLDDDEEDSDEEYYPWNLSGRMLKEVESPYDRAMRIQMANRELFSQPTGKKKKPNRVKFNLVPTAITVDELGNVTEQNMEESMTDSKTQNIKVKDMYRRRQTPPYLMPRRPSINGEFNQPQWTSRSSPAHPNPPVKPAPK